MIKTRPRPKHENTTTSKLVTTCDNCVCNWFAHALGLVHWWDFSRNVGEKLQNQPECPNYGLPGLSYRPYRPALDNANVPYKATFAEMLGKKRCHSEGAPTFMPVWGSATWQPILEYTMLLPHKHSKKTTPIRLDLDLGQKGVCRWCQMQQPKFKNLSP